jgi:hypothetical protein
MPTPAPSKSQAQYVDPRELVADPKAFVGRNVLLQGKTLTVDQRDGSAVTSAYTWVQVMAQVRGRYTTESIIVEMRPKAPNLLRDERYRLYGVVAGTQKVTRTLTGAVNEVPLISGYAWEPAPADSTGIGCASP